MQIRVYYEDTDAAGIVYYANYLRFAERARTELLRKAGLDHRVLLARWGGLFAVRRCLVDYLAPARLDDLLNVTTALRRLGGAVVELDQAVERGAERLVTMSVTLAFLGENLRPKRMPAEVRQIFARRPEAGSER